MANNLFETASISIWSEILAHPALMNVTPWPQWLHLTLLIVLSLLRSSNQSDYKEENIKQFFQKADPASGHTNNWAVLVCASRYWFNYRVSCLTRATKPAWIYLHINHTHANGSLVLSPAYGKRIGNVSSSFISEQADLMVSLLICFI